jgi:uncharacterized coiled-coil DUF342 family protein
VTDQQMNKLLTHIELQRNTIKKQHEVIQSRNRQIDLLERNLRELKTELANNRKSRRYLQARVSALSTVDARRPW